MRKFLLFMACSALAVSEAEAAIATDQLNAVKDIFNQEFQKIDTDKDGVISTDEYMLYQFEMLQKSFVAATESKSETPVVAEETVKAEEPALTEAATEKVAEEKETDLNTMNDTTATLQEMADYEIDFEDAKTDDVDIEDDEWYLKPEKLTEEDVTSEEIAEDPEEIVVPEIDLSISEEENLKNVLSEMTKADSAAATKEQTAAEKQEDAKQMKFMLDAIKKTLPKKIDNITTWTDIVYENNVIDYVYQADMDMSKFNDKEKAALKADIEKVACAQAYAEMCPRIKPMFIDKGINMKIRYYDKNNTEISFCEFNEENCK